MANTDIPTLYGVLYGPPVGIIQRLVSWILAKLRGLGIAPPMDPIGRCTWHVYRNTVFLDGAPAACNLQPCGI